MQDHPLLGQITLGYSAVMDRQRAVAATRLTVFPERPDAAPDAVALQQLLAEVWPETGGALSLRLQPVAPGAAKAPTAGVSLLINAAGEPLLRGLLDAPAVPRFMVEVPAFMAADPLVAASARALHDAGGTLALKGQARDALPAELDGCFALQIDDTAPPAAAGGLPQMLNNSPPGGAVYDPFVGSGTTVIAAETCGRIAYACELDPLYVDVVVRRWQAFTGKEATLEAGGKRFAELEAKRSR